MADLIYYREERARWPDLGGYSRREAEVAVARLVRRFSPPRWRRVKVGLEFVGKNRISWGNASRIRLASWAGWRTLCHEVAHAILSRAGRRHPGERTHGKRHRRMMDRLARFVVRHGWNRGDLLYAEAWRESRKRARAAARAAAEPPPLEAKILDREERIARLDASLRRYAGIVKGIQTRRARAARSLAALRRRRAAP